MAKLREEKKRELFNSIEELAADGEILGLREDVVIDQFTDSQYDAEKVEEILGELEDDGLVARESAKFDLVYPQEHEDDVLDKFSTISGNSLFITYLLGFVSFASLLDWKPIADFFVEVAAADTQVQFFINASFFGIFTSYYLGKIVLKASELIQENVPLVKKYQSLVSPVVGLGVLLTVAVLGFSSMTAQDVTITHVIMIVSVSVGGGMPIGKFLFQTDDST